MDSFLLYGFGAKLDLFLNIQFLSVLIWGKFVWWKIYFWAVGVACRSG